MPQLRAMFYVGLSNRIPINTQRFMGLVWDNVKKKKNGGMNTFFIPIHPQGQKGGYVLHALH